MQDRRYGASAFQQVAGDSVGQALFDGEVVIVDIPKLWQLPEDLLDIPFFQLFKEYGAGRQLVVLTPRQDFGVELLAVSQNDLALDFSPLVRCRPDENVFQHPQQAFQFLMNAGIRLGDGFFYLIEDDDEFPARFFFHFYPGLPQFGAGFFIELEASVGFLMV